MTVFEQQAPNKACPLCGCRMTALESHPGRGELYCGHCDLTIGGNDAKTPDELMALLNQRTCSDLGGEDENENAVFRCSRCGCVLSLYDKDGTNNLCTSFIYDYPRFCPECGRRVVCTNDDEDANDLQAAIDADDGKRYSTQEVLEILERDIAKSGRRMS